MTRFKLLPKEASVHPEETDCPATIAQWAEEFAPCDLLMFGEGIPSSRHPDGVLISIRSGEYWDEILRRVEWVRNWYTVEAPALREKST